jgi:hypothetical protein
MDVTLVDVAIELPFRRVPSGAGGALKWSGMVFAVVADSMISVEQVLQDYRG